MPLRCPSAASCAVPVLDQVLALRIPSFGST